MVGVFLFLHENGSSPRPWGTQSNGAGTVPKTRFIPTPVGNTTILPAGVIVEPVHPHARGEHGITELESAVEGGSSPRPWGTRCCGSPLVGSSRFIPTPVGNTRSHRLQRRQSPVHPHARGEHSDERRYACVESGSSPRPWGTQKCFSHTSNPSRFIPTPVGNTPCCRMGVSGRTVHPHARGEHGQRPESTRQSCGSSPRPWGTPTSTGVADSGKRFIPTPVGNTSKCLA